MLLQVEIIHWDKYNPRRDVKSSSWMRFDNRFITDPKFFGFTCEERCVWLSILCLASQDYRQKFLLNTEQIAVNLRCSEEAVQGGIQKLKDLGCIRASVPNPIESGRIRSDSIGKDPNGRTNETDVTDERTNETDGDPDESGREPDGSHEAVASPAPLHRLAVVWNDLGGKLSKVKYTKGDRKRKCEARWKDAPDGETSESHWSEVVKRIAASDFCNGKNDRAWVATFDWILQPDVQWKALEGKYDNRAKEVRNRAQERSDANQAALAKFEAKLDRRAAAKETDDVP